MNEKDARTGQDDALLLAGVRAGHPDALGALLARYEPTVYRFALRMCRDPEDAKDVLQETLLAAARGAQGFRGESSLSTWLFTIARSFCVKAGRRRAGAPEAPVALDDREVAYVPSRESSPEAALGEREVRAAVDAAIARLEPTQREVLLLRDVEGLTAAEVAAVVSLSVEAVKSRLHRARVEVRTELSAFLGRDEGAAGCPDVVALLSRHLEGDIDEEVCHRMEQHVAACERCATRCDALRRSLSLCRSSAVEGHVPRAAQLAVRRALGMPA